MDKMGGGGAQSVTWLHRNLSNLTTGHMHLLADLSSRYSNNERYHYVRS